MRRLELLKSGRATLEKLMSNDDRRAEDCPQGEKADNPLTISAMERFAGLRGDTSSAVTGE